MLNPRSYRARKRALSLCAQHGRSLKVESPEQAQSREMYSQRQGCPPRGGIRRKPKAKFRSIEQK